MMLDHYQQTKNLLVQLLAEGAGLLLMAGAADGLTATRSGERRVRRVTGRSRVAVTEDAAALLRQLTPRTGR